MRKWKKLKRMGEKQIKRVREREDSWREENETEIKLQRKIEIINIRSKEFDEERIRHKERKYEEKKILKK